MSDNFTFKAGSVEISGEGASAVRAAWVSALQIVAKAVQWIVYVAMGGLAAHGGLTAAQAFGWLG